MVLLKRIHGYGLFKYHLLDACWRVMCGAWFDGPSWAMTLPQQEPPGWEVRLCPKCRQMLEAQRAALSLGDGHGAIEFDT